MNRHNFPFVLAVFLCLLAAARPARSDDKPPANGASLPWKWDVTIYDKPGWFTPWMSPPRLIGDEIVLQCSSHPEDKYADDFYAEKTDTVTLSSPDGGRSWLQAAENRYHQAAPVEPETAIRASLDTRPSFPPELDRRRREGLKQAGLDKLADNPGWTIFPESMSQELKTMGYDAFEQHPMIPNGQVAVYSMSPFGKWSANGGKSWQPSRVDCPTFAHGLVPNGILRLADGTRLWFGYGIPLHESGRCNYVLRSTDNGQNWNTTRIPSDPTWCLSEASPLVLHSGRVLLLFRCDAGQNAGSIYQTWSDDKGKTWQPAKRTPIWGYPLGAICLKSGAVLCTYAHRRFPGGIRACISRDQGNTWDMAHEKILRDDVIPTTWIAPSGAHSVQLPDGSIFTAFTLQRAATLKDGDAAGGNIFHVSGIDGNGRFHCYLAGCRYTEDYVRPLYVDSGKAKWFMPCHVDADRSCGTQWITH